MSKPDLNLQSIVSNKASRFNPLRDFTPEKLTSAISDFRAGRLSSLAQIMDAIEETDDVLQSVAPKAKAAVARHGWEIMTVDTPDDATAALAAQQKKVLEYFYNNLRATSAYDQDELGGVALLLRQMMDAKGKRYSVHNIVWHTEAKMSARLTATFWHVPLWFFENSTGKMRYISAPFGYDGEDMKEGAWLVTKGQGVNIACAVAWIYKHLPLRDWLIYSERCGMPGFEGITDAAYGSEEWNRLVAAVTAAGQDFAFVHSRGDEIKTINFAAAGQLPYPPLVERMDRALSALWRGADLSTISAGSGSGQGASLQGGEADIIEQDDATWLSETLQYKVDRFVLDYAFGTDSPTLAYFKVGGSAKEDTERDLKIDAFLVQNGFPVSKKQASERYNRPLPDAADELLKAPVAPAGSAPGVMPGINEAAAAGREQLFRSESLARLEAAQRDSLKPLMGYLDKIEAAKTPSEYQSALSALRADVPKLYKEVAADPALAKAFEEILGAAVVTGIAQAAKP